MRDYDPARCHEKSAGVVLMRWLRLPMRCSIDPQAATDGMRAMRDTLLPLRDIITRVR